jgi:uncharacterized protein (DUF302 family)
MYQFPYIFVIVFVSLFLSFQSSIHASGLNQAYEVSSGKSLQDILEDLEFAMTEHNLRIVERLHIGQAIKLRGDEDFPDYEVILYCNLTFARQMLELAPEMINTCPGRVSVRGKENSYIISAPLWPEQNVDSKLNLMMQDLNNQLRKIVDYSALEWSKPYEN